MFFSTARWAAVFLFWKGVFHILKQILCLSNEPWSAYPGRTQQLVARLRDAQVLYFSPARGKGDKNFQNRGGQVRPNITAYTLPPILLVDERYSFLFQAGQRKLSRFIAAKAGRRTSAPLLWTTHPSQVHLLDLLDYSGLVYDCDREWTGLPPQWEGGLAAAADVVFAASSQLARRLSPCSSNIVPLPNGVNYPLFSQGDSSPHKRSFQGPVICFSGTVWPDLDLSPLLHAAQTMPEWNFLLVSRTAKGNALLPYLRRLPNVRLTSPPSLDKVPELLYRCDVLVDLLRRDQPYSDLTSSRMYEYLATGKPVVSMLWPDQVEQFPDVVYAAHDEHEFVACCRHALEEAPGFAAQRRRDHAAAASWSIRAGKVAHILSAGGLL